MIRSILYATDLGLFAPYVLQHAYCLACSLEADLHVIHVVEPLGLFAQSVLQTYLDENDLHDLRHGGVEKVMETIEKQVRERFGDELGELEEETSRIMSLKVVQGEPTELILNHAHDLSSDLLVIGSYSHSAEMPCPILGRTATTLLQKSEIPIYLVPIQHHQRR